jgi:hypothetical protein
VDLSFNASTWAVGIRRERLVTLGLPLWSILTAQERVALLAHELAHDTNGDLAHGTLINSALTQIRNWHGVIHPGRRPIVTNDLIALPEALARHLLTGLAAAVHALYRLELSLARRSSPRAEYLADQEADRVASTGATLSLMDKLLLTDSCQFSVARALRRGDRDVWGTVRRDMDGIPARERERLRRIAARQGHRVDETHPPTALRVKALAAGPPSEMPLVEVDASRAAAIDSELAAATARLRLGR